MSAMTSRTDLMPNHAIRQPNFNHKPRRSPCFQRLMLPGILGTSYPAPFDTGWVVGRVARVGLPPSAASTQEPQAQTSDQQKKRASVSLPRVEFGKD